MINNSSWKVVGSSVIGELHLRNEIPCQDASNYIQLRNNWWICAVSDGAGSAEHSDKGSKKTVEFTTEYFKTLIEESLPDKDNSNWSDKDWSEITTSFYFALVEELRTFSKAENIEFKSLAATLILAIKTYDELFFYHIGDGRAGYRNNKGDWFPLMVPIKGEEANSTVFVTTDISDESNIYSNNCVIRDTITSFCLLTDGLEKICFEVNIYNDETEKYEDPNKPFKKFLDPCVFNLISLYYQNILQHKMEEIWKEFLSSGTESIVKETDDKTMILAFDLNMPK